MTCPACHATLPPAQERCPACGTIVAPAVEGALAPDTLAGKEPPLREIPGLRKREKTWKDEVRERVRHRRREKLGGAELPLFPDGGDPVGAEASGPPEPASSETSASASPYAVTQKMELGEAPVDLAIRPLEEAGPVATDDPELPAAEEARGREWSLPEPEIAAPRAVERPARLLERAHAAAIDLGLLLGLWAIVVYFASRAAHVPLSGLLPTWPYLGAYLAFLGLIYAGYFTGTTGQTLGKLSARLRVVDTAGQPPGYVRAFLRALLGALGVALLGTGLVTAFFDPARRALHDRLLRTRVIRV